MGASRQDVNVSVRGGRRVEIKGVPKAGWAPRLVHGEAVRQVNLLALREGLHRRGFREPGDVRIRHEDVTDLFRTSAFQALRSDAWHRFVADRGRRSGFELGEGTFTVRAIRLEGMGGILMHPTQPDHTFAHEIAGRVRVIAGLDQQPILLHDERWPDYTDGRGELRRLKEKMACGPQDALVVVWGPNVDTITAAEEVEKRVVEALDGVPNETRQPFADGRTDFERILPGPDRMYPDTDSPPTRVTRDRVERLCAALPAPPWERERRYADAGVPISTIHYLIRRGGADVVDRVVAQIAPDAAESDIRGLLRRVCVFFGERLKGWRRRAGLAVDRVPEERWVELFRRLEAEPILREVVDRIVRKMVIAPTRTIDECVADLDLGAPPDDWRDRVAESVGARRGEHAWISAEGRLRHHMGRAMATLRGRVPAREVAAVVEGAVAAGEATAGKARREATSR
jgi:glutamyl-tRNA(Gln) amidotransferase subunit E